MTDVPGKRVWGRWPQRVQGGALVFPLDYINKKGQGVTRSVLRTTPWTRWARHAKRALARRAQTRFTYASFLTRVGIIIPFIFNLLLHIPGMHSFLCGDSHISALLPISCACTGGMEARNDEQIGIGWDLRVAGDGAWGGEGSEL